MVPSLDPRLGPCSVQATHAVALLKKIELMCLMSELPPESITFAKLAVNEKKYPVVRTRTNCYIKKCKDKEVDANGELSGCILKWRAKKNNKQRRFTKKGLQAVLAQSKSFVSERNWTGYDSDTNLYLALTSEVGELCGSLSFREESGGLELGSIAEVAEEIADVVIYVCRLASNRGYFESIVAKF